jgi:hypothetical protein
VSNSTLNAEGLRRPPIEAADDPHRLARLFLREHGRLRYQDGKWFADREIPDDEIETRLTRTIKRAFDRLALGKQAMPRKVTSACVADAKNALKSMVHDFERLTVAQSDERSNCE